MSTFLQILIPAIAAFFLGLLLASLLFGRRSADA